MSGISKWFRSSFRISKGRSRGASSDELRNEQRESLKQRKRRSYGPSDSIKEQSRSSQNEGVKTSCQRCEQNELEHRESLLEMDSHYKQKLNDTRNILEQKDREVKLLKHSMAEMKINYEDKLYETRAALKLKEDEVKLFKYRKHIKKQSRNSSCKQCERSEREYRESLAEMETMYKAKQSETRHYTTEMESFYKQRLTVLRSALREKEEQLKSFKDRMAAALTSSIETGDTENMMNPVSQSRLTKMYDKVRLQQWPKVKDSLKANNGSSETSRAVIQKWFQEAAKEMKKRKKQIDETFGLQDNKEAAHQKVKEFRHLTVHNLQLALYHSSREHKEISLPEYEGRCPQDVLKLFRDLLSECYWLGCLMALNRPPLTPDWDRHVPGMDSWDIFPQGVTAVTLT